MPHPRKNLVMAFAHPTQPIFYVMAVTFLVAVRWLPRGRVEVPQEAAVGAG